MLEARCSSAPCPPVAVRAPRSLGDGAAWRVVTASPDVLTHRVLRGGSVLVATGAGREMSLWIDRPGEPRMAFAQGLALTAEVVDLVVANDRVLVSTVKRSTSMLTDGGFVPQ